MSFLNEGWLHPNQQRVMLVTAKKHFVLKALKYRARMSGGSHTRYLNHLRLQLSCCGVKGPLISKGTRP